MYWHDEKPGRRKVDPAFMRFMSMAYQMGGAIGLGVWLGIWADKRWPEASPLFTVAGALLGVGIALYVVIKEASK